MQANNQTLGVKKMKHFASAAALAVLLAAGVLAVRLRQPNPPPR